MELINNIIWRLLKTRLFEPIRPRIFRSNVYRLKGKIQSNFNLSVVILGSKTTLEYFSQLIFVDKPKIEFLGKRTSHGIASSSEIANEDLTIVETNWLFSRFFLNNGFFISPRIDFVLDITDSLESILNRFSESKKRGILKVPKTGYTYEITKDPAKIESFFNEIYLPHMFKRHGKYALPVSFSEFKRLSLTGDLVLIKLGQEYVSGTILVPHRNELHGPIVAVKDVDKQLTLGSYAIYYYTIVLGIQKGYARVDFGETPPFIKDGVFQYKKDFGMQIRPAKESNSQVFAIRFSNMSEPMKNFLKTNPFVLMDENGLSGLMFHEPIDNLSNSIYIPGLSSLYIISSNLDYSNRQGFKLKQLTAEHYPSKTTSALKSLIKICAEEDYSLYHLVFKK